MFDWKNGLLLQRVKIWEGQGIIAMYCQLEVRDCIGVVDGWGGILGGLVIEEEVHCMVLLRSLVVTC